MRQWGRGLVRLRRGGRIALQLFLEVLERPVIGPIALGAALVGGVVAARAAFIVPWALVFGAWTTLAGAFKALAAGVVAGAMGGLGYVLVGREFRRVPGIGHYLAGVATVGAYVASVSLVARWLDPESTRDFRRPEAFYSLVAVSLLVGIFVGHTLFRDRAPAT